MQLQLLIQRLSGAADHWRSDADPGKAASISAPAASLRLCPQRLPAQGGISLLFIVVAVTKCGSAATIEASWRLGARQQQQQQQQQQQLIA